MNNRAIKFPAARPGGAVKPGRRRAFTLMEVVLAIGLLGFAVLAMMALLGPMLSRTGGESVHLEAADWQGLLEEAILVNSWEAAAQAFAQNPELRWYGLTMMPAHGTGGVPKLLVAPADELETALGGRHPRAPGFPVGQVCQFTLQADPDWQGHPATLVLRGVVRLQPCPEPGAPLDGYVEMFESLSPVHRLFIALNR